MERDKADAIEKRVRGIITEQFNITEGEIKRETSLTKDLNADSLDLVQLVMNVEDELGIEISDKDATKMKTYGDVVAHIINYPPK